ncbi:5-hydroxytryptamine receptor 1D-like [Protopterus annectens]|uniref:5-hydroxytryptamine receptor 1D-like n=1 Tax=Protopterus annectens TaxID=7888 RepID=UPI001CF9EC38|nr:5-hydroxytryptamine receptor 1D-like [Protopterus annectens]
MEAPSPLVLPCCNVSRFNGQSECFSERATNSSSSGLDYNLTTKIVLEVVIILMCLVAITGNVLVIFIVAATKHFHSVTSVFIINLAVSDCLVGLGVMPFVALSLLYEDWRKFDKLCLYVGYTSSVYCTASVLTLAAIALDRYHAIIDCLQYNSQRTVRRTVITVIWIWVQAALSSCPPLLGWGNLIYVPAMYSCTVEWASSPSYTGFIAGFSFLLPACVMVFCYIRIVNVARGHARRIHDLENQLQRNSTETNSPESVKPTFSKLIYSVNSKIISEQHSDDSQSISSNMHNLSSIVNLDSNNDILSRQSLPGREHHGALRLFFAIFAFFCCWMPYIIVGIMQAIEKTTSNLPSSIPTPVITVVYWLALLNSDINPLVYALLSKRFQKALVSLYQKLWTKPSIQQRQPRRPSEIPTYPPCRHVRTGSNVTRISHVSQPDRIRHSEQSVFSVGSSGHRSLSEVFLPGQFSSPPTLNEQESEQQENTGNESQDGIILKPEGLPKNYLQVPPVPLERGHFLPSPSLSERQSIFVCGNIIIKVDFDT